MKIVRSILAVLLVICVSVGFCACGDDDSTKASLKNFTKAVESTTPASVTGTVEVTTVFGPLKATFTAVIAEDGSFTLNYSYEQFNDLATGGAGDVTSNKNGTVTYKDGAYSDSSLAAKIPANATAAKLKLDAKKMTYNISADGNVLTAAIKAADTASVLGVAYDGDVSLVVTKNEGKIVSFTLSYTVAETGNVLVVCNYK